MHFNTKLFGWIVVILVVVSAGYSMYTQVAQQTLDQNGLPISGQAVGGDLLELLGKLQTVNFTTDIFNDNNFTSLIDFGITLPPPNLGRPNPFEKIGIDVVTPIVPSSPAVNTKVATTTQTKTR